MSVTTWQKLAASLLSAFTPSLPSLPPDVNGCQLSLVLNAQATVCVLQTIKPGKALAGARGPFKFNMHIQKKKKLRMDWLLIRRRSLKVSSVIQKKPTPCWKCGTQNDTPVVYATIL